MGFIFERGTGYEQITGASHLAFYNMSLGLKCNAMLS
jgi:hypothetical protein